MRDIIIVYRRKYDTVSRHKWATEFYGGNLDKLGKLRWWVGAGAVNEWKGLFCICQGVGLCIDWLRLHGWNGEGMDMQNRCSIIWNWTRWKNINTWCLQKVWEKLFIYGMQSIVMQSENSRNSVGNLGKNRIMLQSYQWEKQVEDFVNPATFSISDL